VVDMTGIPALDLLIGLSFVFFLLATLAMALQELLASVFGLRARTLEQGLRSLLEDPKKGWQYVDKFYDHELIRSLYKTPPPFGGTAPPAEIEHGRNAHVAARGKLARAAAFFKPTKGPSYISPRAFAVVLLDTIAPDPKGGSLEHVEEKVGELPDALKKRIQPLVKEARNDRDQVRTNIEAWYDDTMARVSGWYKRKTQIILVVIGAALVIAVNANTLTMGQHLWKDQTVRSAVVAQAAARPAGGRSLDQAATDVDGVLKIGVPLGWSDANKPSWKGFNGWATTLGGWLLTLAAVMLGAPFWFDALGRLSRLRSSGKPEIPLPATASGSAHERIRTLPIPASIEVRREEAVTGPAAEAPARDGHP
jgi:hypothetical protein